MALSLEALLIYYGFPSLINGSQSTEEACQHFARYQRVILGDGLEDLKHPDHQATRSLMEGCPTTRFYGYIDLGCFCPHHPVQNLSLKQIHHRLQNWRQLGVEGILFDDYGYDFRVTRQRQIQAVQSAHELGLSVIANSWDPGDALGAKICGNNPGGLASPLRAEDGYLMESYLVAQGHWVAFSSWRKRCLILKKVLSETPVEVHCCTTTQAGASVEPASAIQFLSFSAWMDGHRSFAWGEPFFSAGDNLAPWHRRPDLPQRRPSRISVSKTREEIDVFLPGSRLQLCYKQKRVQELPPLKPWRRWLEGWSQKIKESYE